MSIVYGMLGGFSADPIYQSPKAANFHINLPPPYPDGYKPWLPSDQQIMRPLISASILDPIGLGLAANLIQDLLKKRKSEASGPRIQKSWERSFVYLRYDSSSPLKVQVRLTLRY